MKKMFQAAVVAAAVLAVPALSMAQAKPAAPAAPAAAKTTAKKTTAAVKTAHGVVKSMDASSLVLTEKGKTAKDVTFALDNSTQKEGDVAVGSTVTVKYHTEGTTMTATDVKAAAAKPAKPAKAPKAAKK